MQHGKIITEYTCRPTLCRNWRYFTLTCDGVFLFPHVYNAFNVGFFTFLHFYVYGNFSSCTVKTP